MTQTETTQDGETEAVAGYRDLTDDDGNVYATVSPGVVVVGKGPAFYGTSELKRDDGESTAPQAVDVEAIIDLADAYTGSLYAATTAGDGGTATEAFVDTLDTRQKRTWQSQERFLGHYASLGNVSAAAAGAGIDRTLPYLWEKQDRLGFKARWEAARQTFADALETTMHERLADPTGNRGSDILLMFALKAARPEKYKDNVVLTDDGSKDMLVKLQKLQQAAEKVRRGEKDE